MAKIVIIEDEDNLRFSIGRSLSKAGHSVSEADAIDPAWRLIQVSDGVARGIYARAIIVVAVMTVDRALEDVPEVEPTAGSAWRLWDLWQGPPSGRRTA